MWSFLNRDAGEVIGAGLARLLIWALGWGLCLGIAAIFYALHLLH